MVVLVIVALLASLTLAGLSGVRERAKADKTRSTIRKINAVIQPMYESYATRRVPATGSRPRDRAESRLRNIRLIMTVEMPDLWGDAGVTLPASFNWAQNAVHRRYSAYKAAVNAVTAASNPRFQKYESAETLMMILSRSGFEPDCMEAFRADEIGDIDRDGAPEFRDGWGRPIAFRRWPASFISPLISTSTPDPLDTMRVTGDWAMVPLIFSAGADEATNDPLSGASGYAFQHRTLPWLPSLTGAIPPVPSTCVGNDNGKINAADLDEVRAASDNITNYDLLKK